MLEVDGISAAQGGDAIKEKTAVLIAKKDNDPNDIPQKTVYFGSHKDVWHIFIYGKRDWKYEGENRKKYQK